MERRLAGMKNGVPVAEAAVLSREWASSADADTLRGMDPGIADIEAANLAKQYARWHVQRIGHMEQTRPDGVFRIMGGQINSASSSEVRARKTSDIIRLINDWEIQGGCLSEVGIDWITYRPSANLASWFRLELPDIRSHTAHNKHEQGIAHHQPGGTATIACKELVRYVKNKGDDFRGLGRWCSTLMYADKNHRFRIVLAYNVGRQAPRGDSTIFQQQLRYIQNHHLSTTPRRLFMIDFLAMLQAWRQQGDRLLIFMDMNEHILNGPLARRMARMGLEEATHKNWGSLEPHTYVGGKEPIDAVFHSPDLDVTATMQL